MIDKLITLLREQNYTSILSIWTNINYDQRIEFIRSLMEIFKYNEPTYENLSEDLEARLSYVDKVITEEIFHHLLSEEISTPFTINGESYFINEFINKIINDSSFATNITSYLVNLEDQERKKIIQTIERKNKDCARTIINVVNNISKDSAQMELNEDKISVYKELDDLIEKINAVKDAFILFLNNESIKKIFDESLPMIVDTAFELIEKTTNSVCKNHIKFKENITENYIQSLKVDCHILSELNSILIGKKLPKEVINQILIKEYESLRKSNLEKIVSNLNMPFGIGDIKTKEI